MLDEIAGHHDGVFRLVRVVEGLQLEDAPVDPSALVRLVERSQDSELHVYAELPGGTAECGGLAEQDTVLRYADESVLRVIKRTGHSRGVGILPLSGDVVGCAACQNQ